MARGSRQRPFGAMRPLSAMRVATTGRRSHRFQKHVGSPFEEIREDGQVAGAIEALDVAPGSPGTASRPQAQLVDEDIHAPRGTRRTREGRRAAVRRRVGSACEVFWRAPLRRRRQEKRIILLRLEAREDPDDRTRPLRCRAHGVRRRHLRARALGSTLVVNNPVLRRRLPEHSLVEAGACVELR